MSATTVARGRKVFALYRLKQSYTAFFKTFLSVWKTSDLHISDRSGTRTHNHLVRKWTLSHLANGWVFVYELSVCGFESRCSHLNFSYRACFEQEVPCLSGNYRVWIHSKMRTWHDQNIQSSDWHLLPGDFYNKRIVLINCVKIFLKIFLIKLCRIPHTDRKESSLL